MSAAAIELVIVIILAIAVFALLTLLWYEQGTSVPPRQVEASARSKPLPLETEAAPGGAPGAERAWPDPPAPGAVPHGRHAAGTPRLIEAQQEDAWEAAQVIAAENERQRLAEAVWRDVNMETLDLVAKRLRQLSVPQPTLVDVAEQYHSMPAYGQAPQLAVEPELARRVIA